MNALVHLSEAIGTAYHRMQDEAVSEVVWFLPNNTDFDALVLERFLIALVAEGTDVKGQVVASVQRECRSTDRRS